MLRLLSEIVGMCGLTCFLFVTRGAFLVAATEDERKNAEEFFTEVSSVLCFKDTWNAALWSASLRSEKM